MGKNKNSIKDFLYNSMDYIIIVSIVLVVGTVISWRLDLLFNEDNIVAAIEESHEEAKTEIVKKEKAKLENTNKEKVQVEEKNLVAKKDNLEIEKATRKKTLEDDKKKPEAREAKININIPEGSDSTTIANILESSGAISDSKAFLDKCEEMQKATKLKAGDFEIEKNSSLEEIITSITK